MTIQEQVDMWNKFIAMNEEYVVMYNELDTGVTVIITEPLREKRGGVFYPINDTQERWAEGNDFFPNLILYRLTRLDPQQESLRFSVPLRMDRGER